MSKPFPFFYLPYVTLSEIFKNFEPQDLLKLAICSKRAFGLTKSMKNRRRKLVFIVVCSTVGSIGFRNDKEEHIELFSVGEFEDFDPTESFDFLNLNGKRFPYKEGIWKNSLEIYSPMDRFDGIKALSEFVSELFGLPIHKLHVSGEHNVNDPRRCIDWIMGRQKTLEECCFTCDQTNDEELAHFLDTCRVTKVLRLMGRTSDEFLYSFNHPMELETIEIFHAQWPTVENIFEWNSKYIGMPETNFTNLDINRVLKNWLNGGNSRLQLLIVGVAPLDIGEVVNGINMTRRDHQNQIEFFFSEEMPLTFDYSFDIQREDGTICSILLDTREERVEPYITLAVWPDWKGRVYPI